MTSRILGSLAGAALMLGATVAATSVGAQNASTNVVATQTDWSVFVEDNPKECWAVSQPKETVNTRDGRVVAVRRGEILLFVFYRPEAGVNGQVSFTGGYPFADGSTVELTISGTQFLLYPGKNNPDTPVNEAEWAWPASAEDDAKIIAAMKRGSDAVVTARSGRGTNTSDTFSLLGFTAATDDAAGRCQ